MHSSTTELTSFSRYLLVDAAFDFGLTVSEYKVYSYLTRKMDSNQQMGESIDDIAQACRINRNTVMRAIETMVQMGMIRRLESKRRGYIYELTSPLDWVDRAVKKQRSSACPDLKSGQQLLQAKNVTNNKIRPVTFLDPKVEQLDSALPLRGSAESGVVPSEEEPKKLTEVQKFDCQETEPEAGDLDSKIAAARSIGCNVGTPWINGVMMVAINGTILSVKDFMQRSLSSFEQILQPCVEGIALCREKIKVLEQRMRERRQALLEKLATGV